jgi:glycosyltransferase involved in cell wall biosynthesis
MKFSLILTTLGNEQDLDRFFEALWRQSHRDFEVIVIGPTNADRVIAYLEKWKGKPVRYGGGAKGHSKALNLGLEQASGDIVAFPDEDSWYPEDLLERLALMFRQNPQWTGITGRSLTAEGAPSSGRWAAHGGPITRSNVLVRACTITIFVRRSVLQKIRFDETLGIGAGTPWGGGEDPDFVLQIINAGHTVFYDPSITVNHPEWVLAPYPPSVCQKAESYARGLGRVLRKHGYPARIVTYHVLRPLGGTLLALLGGNRKRANYHWSIFLGRIAGGFSHVAVGRRRRTGSDAVPVG